MDLVTHIDKIRDVDDNIFKIIEASLLDLTMEVLKSEYPFTGKALVMLVTKSNFIKNSIFDVCENEDLYSANILYRSLIEHFLRHQYLFLNYAKRKNDDIGIDYYNYCDMGENLDFLKSIKSTNKIFDPEHPDINTWEEISKLDKRFSKISPKELKEKSEQFRYRNIIKFLSSTLSLKDSMLNKIIPLYSELSSFVHGGPYGENMLFAHGVNEKDRIEKLKNICEMTFEISKGIKLYTYLFAVQINQKYGIFYNQINEASVKI